MMSVPTVPTKKRRLSVVPTALNKTKSKSGTMVPPSPQSPLPPNNDAEEKQQRHNNKKTNASHVNNAISNENHARNVVSAAAAASAAEAPKALDNAALAELYATCINMSTQNKINQKNAWSLNLIEHIDDVLEADERAAAGRAELVTTNFQKASCTVETSVKIYCYRVDAVHSETFKMLGGLTRAEADAESDASDNDDAGNGDAAENGEQQFDEDGNPIAKPKKIAKRGRKDRAGAATLETNPESLDLKAGADTVLSVDPLFRKTSAKFDQGGTRGLLLNHLQVTPSMQLLFDSGMPVVQPLSDVGVPVSSQSQADEAQSEEDKVVEKVVVDDEDEEGGDIDDGMLAGLLSMAAVRASANLCPTFQNWSWDDDTADANVPSKAAAAAGKDKKKKDGLFGEWDSKAADIIGIDLGGETDELARKIDFAAPPIAVDDNDDGNWFGGDDGGFHDGGDDDDAPLLHAADNVDNGQSIAAAIVHQPSRADAAFVAGEAPATVTGGMALVANMLGANDQQNDYQFFDASLLKNWAGPAHWKFSKVPARTAAAAAAPANADGEAKSEAALAMGVVHEEDDEDEDDGTTKRKRSRAVKSKTMIDFTNPPDVDFDKAFKTVPVAQTTLTATMRARLAEQPTTLPPDLHFDVRSLTALFNNPKWSVVPMDKRRRLSTAPVDDVDNGMGANRDAAEMLGETRFDDYDDDEFGGDGGGFGAEDDGAVGAGLVTLSQAQAGLDLVASPLKPQKVTIGFQRKAKRVDVRLLKRSIWQELSRKLGESGNDDNDDDDADDEGHGKAEGDDDEQDKGRAVAGDVRTGAPMRKMHEPRDFRAILDVIPSRPDAAKVGEISVPLSFICLLHLCNEKRLLLEPVNGSLMVRPPK